MSTLLYPRNSTSVRRNEYQVARVLPCWRKRPADTNVVVAGMRCPTGASASLLMAARQGKLMVLANVALEYEATYRRTEHGVAAGLKPGQAAILIDAVIAMVKPVETT